MDGLGERLREQRGHVGMSQRALARAAGISSAYLSQLENGLKQPSLDVLDRLAEELGVGSSALLGDEGTPPLGLPTGEVVHGARALAEIEREVRSPAALLRLVDRVREYLAGPLGERLGAYRQVAEDYVALVDAFAHHRYRSLPGAAIVVVVASLSYLIDPEDVWPDAHPHGHVDDLAILAFTRALVADDLVDFRRWRAQQGTG